jgi:methylenetetrahydrofolate dehydrogenase (NADP+)/methenyltetrahydrofolate cyclohydrolase
MPGIIIDGRKISAEIKEELKVRVERLRDKGIIPGLAGILVGENADSVTYIKLKEKGSTEVGIYSQIIKLPQDVAERELFQEIMRLNSDAEIHGIFIQLPLPAHLNEGKVLSFIFPDKDVDGLHPVNIGRAWLGQPGFLPATSIGIYELLIRYGYNVKDKRVVIINADNLLGKPLASILVQEKAGANVTLCHPSTPNLASYTRTADILVVSVNKPNFITADMVKKGVLVIDFGANYVEASSTEGKGKLVGDVDFEAVKEKAEAITPVPGGVGPMTVTMLLANTVMAAERQAGWGIT